MESDRRYLMRMSQSIGHIEEFARKGRSALTESTLVRHAVLWNLELLSVAARQLSDEEKEEHSEVNWDHVCRLSREVIGNPWEVDSNKLWVCLEHELPALRHQIKEILISRQMK